MENERHPLRPTDPIPATPSLEPVGALHHPRVFTVASRSTREIQGTRVWGLSPAQRIERILEHASPQSHDAELLIAEDLILDEKVLRALAARPGTLLVDDRGVVAAACAPGGQREALARWLSTGSADDVLQGLEVRRGEDLVDTYDPLLRKAMSPVATRLRPATRKEIEARLFHASYKGVTDFVTKWLWPLPAREVTRWLAHWGVTPNAVTLVSWALAIAATLLFAAGNFGLGLLAAWGMTFLDTVDGKLARVTLQSSRLGDVLDHGLDIIHPPFWYAAWMVGVNAPPSWWASAAWVVIAGYVVGRLLEGLFMLLFRIETHSWRPLDSWFRTITARRNPNLVLLSAGVLFARPDLGFASVAIWTAISLVFHTARLLQAALWHLRGGVVEPWYLGRGAALALLSLALAAAPLQASGPPEDTEPVPTGTASASPREPAPSPAAPPPEPNPTRPPEGIGATPLRSGSASQSWDFAMAFDSGHQLFVRFLISNVGMGDNNAAAVWHLITPDGSAHHFKNGRQESGWSLEERGLRLRIGSSVLSLAVPRATLAIQKKKVKIDVSFALPEAMQHRIRGHGQSIDVVSLALPVEASLWFRAGMREAVQSRGLATLTRVEAERGDAALRRAEYLSLDPDRRWYVTEVLEAGGARHRWGVWLEDGRVRVAERVSVCGSQGSDYPQPRSVLAEGADRVAQISVKAPFLRYDPLDSLPSVIRFVFPTRPMRLWSRVRFEGREPAGSFGFDGISRVSFGDPVPSGLLGDTATRGGECEPDSAS